MKLFWYFISLLLMMIVCQGCVAALEESGPDNSAPAVLVVKSAQEPVPLAENAWALDISSLINQEDNVHLPYSAVLYTVMPGGMVSPSAVLPDSEVLYIQSGTAMVETGEEEIPAQNGDAVIIAAGEIRSVTNTGGEELIYYSFTAGEDTESGTSSGEETHSQLIPRADVEPVVLGNESYGTLFTVTRLVNPGLNPLSIPYDMTIASVPAGNRIEDHYIEGRSQLFIVLDGSATISVSCTPYQIGEGDMIYVPEDAIQSLIAGTDINLLMITYPYYQEMFDHGIDDGCGQA